MISIIQAAILILAATGTVTIPPATPDFPVKPSIPSNPNTPVTPNTPPTPSAPVTPNAPATPNTPSSPKSNSPSPQSSGGSQESLQTPIAPGDFADPVDPQYPSPQTPKQTGPKQPSGDACSSLKNKDHVAFSSKLTGNERILFCSIFDDEQRQEVIAYIKAHPQTDPKDAVILIAKDNDLLFSTKRGGACGAH